MRPYVLEVQRTPSDSGHSGFRAVEALGVRVSKEGFGAFGAFGVELGFRVWIGV